MSQKFKLEDKEYEVSSLSKHAKMTFSSLKFESARMQELENMQALLQRAKDSYINSLKREMLSNKAGILLEE